ncbi:MAG: hypothetical protein ACRD2C_14275, partial [Acidimicrobiales bacterium]
MPASADPPPDGGEPEIVDWWDDLVPPSPDDDPVAPVEPTESAPPIVDQPFEAAADAAVELPSPGTAELTLGGVGTARQAGDLPLEVAAESAATRGESLRVEVLDREAAARAGVRGFAFRLTSGDGATLSSATGEELPASVEVDYSGFRDLYGAGYGDRLRVIGLPECAFADPVPVGCERVPTLLASRNDREAQRLVVNVPDLAEVQGAPELAATVAPSPSQDAAADEDAVVTEGST